MPKYLTQFSYSTEGLQGLIKEGGSKRREAVEEAARSAGCKVEAFYFAFGEHDGILILDGPQESALAFLLAVGGSGAVRLTTTLLITPEDADQAVKKHPSYRPPGK